MISIDFKRAKAFFFFFTGSFPEAFSALARQGLVGFELADFIPGLVGGRHFHSHEFQGGSYIQYFSKIKTPAYI